MKTSRRLPVRRAATGLVAGLSAALVVALTPATVRAAAPAVVPAFAPAVRSQEGAGADRAWTTVHERLGAKVQACRRGGPGAYKFVVRLNARKAKKVVRARHRIDTFEFGAWVKGTGFSSDWRRRGVDQYYRRTAPTDDPIRMRVRIMTRGKTPAYTDWIDLTPVGRC